MFGAGAIKRGGIVIYGRILINMKIAMQIDQISIARAANAAHYEYLDTVRKRTEETRLENELWKKAVEEFREAFEKEDKALLTA